MGNQEWGLGVMSCCGGALWRLLAIIGTPKLDSHVRRKRKITDLYERGFAPGVGVLFMRTFFLWSPPNAIMAIDVTGPRQFARSYSSYEFESWEEAEHYFLGLGAPHESVSSAGDALKEKGMAKLTF